MPPPPQRRTRFIAALAALVVMNGAWMAFAWLSWVPRDLLEVVALPPAQLEGRSPLRFAFNLDMVGDERLGQPPVAAPEIAPAVPGSWSWADARTLVFTPSEDLPPASVFNIRLAREALRAESGLRLGHDVRLAVHTPALVLQGARVESYAAGGRAIIVLDFNQAVDPADIARVLRIADAAGAPLPAAAAPQVTALAAAPSARIRLRIESGERFELAPAMFSLPSGTRGIAGPLGLAATWQARLDLGHVLSVRTVDVDAPPHGDITVHLATTTTAVPLDVLSSALVLQPPVPFTIHATPQGLDLVGAFRPGDAYRIMVTERWPEDVPLHPLAAYPAGSSWAATIPARRPGVWLDDPAVRGGRLVLGAQAVTQADLEVLPWEEEQPLLTSAIMFRARDDHGRSEATLDVDQLCATLPAGRYRLRVRGGDAAPVLAETVLAIDEVPLRPRDLAVAAVRWLAQGAAGDGEADIGARRVRLGR